MRCNEGSVQLSRAWKRARGLGSRAPFRVHINVIAPELDLLVNYVRYIISVNRAFLVKHQLLNSGLTSAMGGLALVGVAAMYVLVCLVLPPVASR